MLEIGLFYNKVILSLHKAKVNCRRYYLWILHSLIEIKTYICTENSIMTEQMISPDPKAAGPGLSLPYCTRCLYLYRMSAMNSRSSSPVFSTLCPSPESTKVMSPGPTGIRLPLSLYSP